MRKPIVLASLFAVSACATAGSDAGPDVPDHDDGMHPMQPVTEAEIRVSPSGWQAHLTGDAPAIHDYTATLVSPDGSERDVTGEVTFSLADTRYGKFHGNQLEVMGGGAGTTEVVASMGTRTGAAPVTVYVSGVRFEGAPPEATALFDQAIARGGCAPAIAYPEDHTTVPANLGALDVHWTDAANDMFAVHVHNLYVDLVYYTMGDTWMTVTSDWSKFQTSRAPISIDVTGMRSTTPTAKCVAASRTVHVTNADAKGAVYWWSTNWLARSAGQSGQGIMKYDLATPQIEASPLVTSASARTSCVGCHALSRDGSKIALTTDSPTGRGSVVDLASGRELMPTGGTAPIWSTAVFNHDGTKLVTVKDGQMTLISAGGAPLATIPSSEGAIAGNPEVSPDGTQLVNIETTGMDDWAFPNASIVVRSFDDRANTFGPARALLPFDAGSGIQSYYPSWSPDGEWLAVTRSPNGNSYANPDATIWVVKADGSQPPIEIAASEGGMMDSWARWMPFPSAVGDEPVYFLTFSSTRPFGVRVPDGGLPQIWVAPFFPKRATAGMPASGPAYRAPFQSIYSSNHNAQWTTAVVTPQ